MTVAAPPPGKPWYAQFWPWFLIALPASSVVAGIATLVIAVRNADSLVRPDYYDAGVAINDELALERAAASRRIAVTLRVDEGRGELAVDVTGEGIDPAGELVLDLSHPTHAERDRSFRLAPSPGGGFRARLADHLRGHWYASLAPVQGGWRLASRIDFGAPTPIRIGAPQ